MLPRFHVDILHLALDEVFSPRALGIIVKANLGQDRLPGQVGHDEYHFDNNAFEQSYAYIEEQRALTISSLMRDDASSAWAAFGRLTHTAQDFYAHSNYVSLWLSQQTAPVVASDISALEPNLIHSEMLRTGKIYLLELLTLIPPLKPLILPLLPRDAHAWMNLDSPKCGPNFEYAFQAAVKRTRIEFEKTTQGLPETALALFLDEE